jgi:cytochrome P450 family 6/cytochrome P450 family 28
LEPEVIKDIFIRKFHNFRNNEFSDMINPKNDPLFAKNPFFLKDDEWKEKRSEITPAFTNNRLKALYPLVQDVLQRMVKHINEKCENAMEARELSARFTIDVVSNCIYGIDAHSFTEDNPPVREMGKKLLEPSATLILKIFLLASFPFLKNIVSIKFTADDVQSFFVDLMDQALKYREENNVQREDFLDYVINLQKKKNIDKLEMASHTISFFTDGFETSSLAICHALYEVSMQIISKSFRFDDDKNKQKFLSKFSACQ